MHSGSLEDNSNENNAKWVQTENPSANRHIEYCIRVQSSVSKSNEPEHCSAANDPASCVKSLTSRCSKVRFRYQIQKKVGFGSCRIRKFRIRRIPSLTVLYCTLTEHLRGLVIGGHVKSPDLISRWVAQAASRKCELCWTWEAHAFKQLFRYSYEYQLAYPFSNMYCMKCCFVSVTADHKPLQQVLFLSPELTVSTNVRLFMLEAAGQYH